MHISQFQAFIIDNGLAAELTLLLGILAMVPVLVFFRKQAFGLGFWITAFSLIAAFYTAGSTPVEGESAGFIFTDHTSYIKRVLCVLGSVGFFSFMEWRQGRPLNHRPEIFMMLMAALVGLMLLVQCNRLWIMFLAAELFSICSFALARPQENHADAIKSVIQYFGVGALASAIGIFGMSLLVGFDKSSGIPPELFVFQSIGGLFYISFLLFKLGAFPFHFWVAGIYEHTPTPWVGFISVAPKVAGAFGLLHISKIIQADIELPLTMICMAGVTLGNLSALKSQSLKNMMAYSSVAQAAILLVPAIFGSRFADTESQLVVFAVAYAIVNQGTFCVIQYFENHLGDGLQISQLAGLFRLFPLPSVMLFLLVVALAGLPPTIGFTGKLLVFSTLIPLGSITERPGLIILFSVLVFNTLLALGYYIRIPYHLIFKTRSQEIFVLRSSVASFFFAFGASLFAVLAFFAPSFFFPQP